jgi:hypothetical protein
MTTLTMRYIKGDFVVTGPDIERVKFVLADRRSSGGAADSTFYAVVPTIARERRATRHQAHDDVLRPILKTPPTPHKPIGKKTVSRKWETLQ